MPDILILYYSENGSTAAMATQIARGVDSVTACSATLRTVPKITSETRALKPLVPDAGPPYATLEDLTACDGLVLGSPTHFGNMAGAMKHFLDQTSTLWFKGALAGKPAGVFTSTSSMHGGQETTLLSMMIPLLHHGMLITGLSYEEPSLMTTTAGGTPYGPSHVAGIDNDQAITEAERKLCRSLGERIATLSSRLAN